VAPEPLERFLPSYAERGHQQPCGETHVPRALELRVELVCSDAQCLEIARALKGNAHRRHQLPRIDRFEEEGGDSGPDRLMHESFVTVSTHQSDRHGRAVCNLVCRFDPG
jgi:hypothetical protein